MVTATASLSSDYRWRATLNFFSLKDFRFCEEAEQNTAKLINNF